jgi:hypothetical protein
LSPEQPSFEELDDKMQAGYELLASRQVVAACRTWLEAWRDMLRVLDKAGMQSIEEFDDRFRGSGSLFNWIQDLEDSHQLGEIVVPVRLSGSVRRRP